MEEFRRVFNRKFLILFAGVILLNLGLFAYRQTGGQSISEFIFESREREWIVRYYSSYDNSTAVKVIQNDIELIQNYRRQTDANENTYTQNELPNNEKSAVSEELYENNECLKRYVGLISWQQTVFLNVLREVSTHADYIAGYSDSIKQIQLNAKQLTKYSIFADESSFSYNNIIKTASDFERASQIELFLVNDAATENFVSYYYIFYLSLGLMVFILYELFMERENGMWEMVHSAGSGRLRLAAVRLGIIAAASAVITAGLYFSTCLLSFILYKGWNSLSAPVQTIHEFSKFTLPMSQFGYILYNFAVSAAAVFALGTLLWMIFVLCRKRNHALIAAGLTVGLEVFLYQNIQSQSIYGILRQINIVRLMKINEIISTYANRGWGSFVVSETQLLATALVVVFTVSALSAVCGTVYMRPQQKKSVLAVIFDRIWEGYQRILAVAVITAKEFHKSLITARGITVALVIFLITAYFVGYGKMTFSDSAKDRDEIYLSQGGKEYTQIEEMVSERIDDYRVAVLAAQECSERYDNGEASLEELTEASNTVFAYSSRLGAVSEFQEKLTYLEKIRTEYGIDGYMISDRGYEEIFGKYSKVRELVILIVLSAGIVLIISENAAIEHRTGMENIVRSSCRGRSWIQKKRFVSGLILTIILFIVIYGFDIAKMYSYYGMPYLDAPLMSLTFMEGCFLNGTIGTWIFLRLLVRFVYVLAVFVLSYMCGKAFAKRNGRAVSFLLAVGVIASVVLFDSAGWLL